MALSQSTMFLFLETNSLLKYELMLPDKTKKIKYCRPTSTMENISEYSKFRKDPKKFYEYTHMDIKVFNYILECVRDKLTEPDIHDKICKLRSAEDKLFVTIRFMASGMSLKDISESIGQARSITTRVIYSTLTAIWETLHDVHLKPPTPDEMPATADKFFAKWQFPNAVGAIGAKYIPTKVLTVKRRKSAVEQALRKTSLILTAVADADFRLSAIDVTKYFSDQEERSFDDIFGNAGSRGLPGSSYKMPYVILGNETFSLKTHLLCPYYESSKPLHRHCVIYNNRLMAARLTVEVAFQILTEKFMVFGKPIILDLEMVGLIVRVGCLLYNIVKDIDGDFDPHFRDIGMEDKGYLNLYMVRKECEKHDQSTAALAGQLRDLFKRYIFQHNL